MFLVFCKPPSFWNSPFSRAECSVSQAPNNVRYGRSREKCLRREGKCIGPFSMHAWVSFSIQPPPCAVAVPTIRHQCIFLPKMMRNEWGGFRTQQQLQSITAFLLTKEKTDVTYINSATIFFLVGSLGFCTSYIFSTDFLLCIKASTVAFYAQLGFFYELCFLTHHAFFRPGKILIGDLQYKQTERI